MGVNRKGMAAAVVAAAVGAVVFAPISAARLDGGAAAPRALERPAPIKNPRLESRLAQVTAAAPPQALGVARRAGLDTTSNGVRVMVEGAAARAAVLAVGGTVESAVGALVEALVAPAKSWFDIKFFWTRLHEQKGSASQARKHPGSTGGAPGRGRIGDA